MLYEATDREAGVVAWWQASPFDPHDFDVHRECLARLGKDPALAARVLCVLFADESAPPPGAVDRRAYHATIANFPSTARGMLVSRNPIARGAITAMSWLGALPFPIETFATWDDVDASHAKDPVMRERCLRAKALLAGIDEGLRAARTGGAKGPGTGSGGSSSGRAA